MAEAQICACETGTLSFENFEEADLGIDQHRGEVLLKRCRHCRRLWLKRYYAQEAFTGWGRWYEGLVPPELETSVKAESALEFLGKLDGYLCGGSYFDGRIFKSQGPPEHVP